MMCDVSAARVASTLSFVKEHAAAAPLKAAS